MFLRALSIENVRSIEHLEIDFAGEKKEGRKWTIVLGENGTGKSTILRAAALVLGGSDILPLLAPDPQLWVRNGARAARISARIATAKGELRTISVDITRGQTVSEIVKRNHKNLAQLDAALGHAGRSYFVAGYGASRRLPGADAPSFTQSEAFTHLRAQAVASLFSRDATLRALDAWAMDLDYRMEAAGVEMIRGAMAELLPGVGFLRIDRQQRQLLFETPDGPVPLQQLSDGYQNMASWTGDLLFRITETFQNYKRPLDARGLLLLDEIDLHLHPKWQRQLVAFLDRKFPNLQILATTHSPFTAQQAPPGALHVLEREPHPRGRGPVLSARQHRGDPKLLRIDQLLEPLLGLKTTESLAAQRVRTKQRTLREKRGRSASEERSFQELTAAVRVLPQAQAIDASEQARLDLLREIGQHLSGASPTAPSRVRGAKKVPVLLAEPAPSVDVLENVFRKMALELPTTEGSAKAPRKRARGKKSR